MEDSVNNTSFEGFCIRYGISCSYAFSPFLVGLVIVNIALCAVLAIAAVLGNGLVFAAYYYSESLRRPAHILLLSLAATDLLSGLVAQPAFILKNCLLITGCHKAICTVQQLEWLAMSSLTGATMFNLSMITVDRYIAICHSYRYEELVTNARVKRAACLLWFGWLVSVFAWCVLGLPQSFLFIVVVPLNIVIVAFLYVKIYVEIRRVASNQQSVGTTEQEQKAQRKKSATTLGCIFGLLFFCFVPAIVYIILRRSGVIVKYEYREPGLLLSTNAAFSNSFLNVLVYYWRNEEMREAMRKVLRKVRQKFQNEVNP